jgi:hypothetical protein
MISWGPQRRFAPGPANSLGGPGFNTLENTSKISTALPREVRDLVFIKMKGIS